MGLHTKLFEHQPASLLPLLEAHLPASIFVYDSLFVPSSSSQPSHAVRVGSTIPTSSDGSTVPVGAPGTIIVALPPASGQVRVFDTAESAFHPPPPDEGNDESDSMRDDASFPSIEAHSEIDHLAEHEGRIRVMGALKSFIAEIGTECKMIGGLHELWVKAVQDLLGDGISRPGCGLWLPPRPSERGNGTPGENGDESEARRNWPTEGYEVDIGRECDIEAFSGGSDIARDLSYYRSRLPWSTVIRPISSSDHPASSSAFSFCPLPAVCHILTGPDGSLGTLSTHPQHRRKGLARWIVEAHIESGRGSLPTPDGLRAYTVIFDRNEASRGMFTGLGWRRAWGCSWVGIGHGEEGEAVRRRAREVDGIREELRGSELAERNTLQGR